MELILAKNVTVYSDFLSEKSEYNYIPTFVHHFEMVAMTSSCDIPMEFHHNNQFQNGEHTAKTIFISFKKKLGSYNEPYIVTFLRNKQFVGTSGLANSLFPEGQIFVHTYIANIMTFPKE